MEERGTLSARGDSVQLGVGKGRISVAGARADEGIVLAGCG